MVEVFMFFPKEGAKVNKTVYLEIGIYGFLLAFTFGSFMQLFEEQELIAVANVAQI